MMVLLHHPFHAELVPGVHHSGLADDASSLRVVDELGKCLCQGLHQGIAQSFLERGEDEDVIGAYHVESVSFCTIDPYSLSDAQLGDFSSQVLHLRTLSGDHEVNRLGSPFQQRSVPTLLGATREG